MIVESNVRRIAKLLSAHLLLFVFTFLCSISISKATGGSPYDEVAHADMVYQTYSQKQIPPPGAILNSWTVAQAGCRGFIPPSPDMEKCLIGPYDANALAADGLNTASGYPPMYYISSGIILEFLTSIGLPLDFDLLRLSSSLLFALGINVLFALILYRTRSFFISVVGSLWVLSIPIVIFQGSTINPESMSILVGSTLVLLSLRIPLNLKFALLLGLASTLGMLVKPSFIFAAISALAIFSFRAIYQERTQIRTKFLLVSTPLMSFTLLNASWELFKKSRELPIVSTLDSNETFGQLASDISIFKRVFISLRVYLSVTSDQTQKGYLDGTLGYQVAAFTGTLLFATVITLGMSHLMRVNLQTDEEILHSAAVLALVFGTLILVISTQILTNIFFVTGRYALPLIPILLAAIIPKVGETLSRTWYTKLATTLIIAMQMSYLEPVKILVSPIKNFF